MTDALLQTALLIALGWALQRGRFAKDAFWRGFDRLVYWVFLPVLFFRVLARADFSGATLAALGGAATLAILALSALLFAARPLLQLEGGAFTSVFQGSIRFNSYVALATIPAAYGETGLVLLTLLIAVVVPLVNVLSVLMLSLFSYGTTPTPGRVVRSVVTNPLVLGCTLGLLSNALGLYVPAGLDGVLAVLGRAALPCGLLAVGAGLMPEALGLHARGLSASAVAKFVLLPLFSFWIGTLLRLPPEALAVLVVFQTQPTATSSYILARQLGGDAELMASIITGQTLLAFAALPLAAWLLG